MAGKRAKKKENAGEGVTMSAGDALGLSIGSLLGVPRPQKQESAALQDDKKAGEKTDSKEKKNETQATGLISGIPKAVLARERSGHGGKTVTVLSLPENYRGDREALAKEMRRGLGCGSRVEGSRIVLQGDIGDRAQEWLIKKGVKNVVRGN